MPKLQVRILLSLLLLFALLEMQIVAAVPSECQDIWRVDLYAVARLNADEQYFSKLKYYRWQNNRWQASDAEVFFDTQQPEIPLIVFTPGYTLTAQQTTQVGFGIVRNFDPNKPCRVVFWNWYSERGNGNIRRDLQNKIKVVNNTAGYLALFLQALKPQSKACLFGFSYGGRVTCNAAEALRKNNQQPEGLRLHLVLSGAATDREWFAKGHRHENIPQIAEKILVTYNPDDWALPLYHLIYDFRCDTIALGLEGVPMRSVPPEFRDRFESIDVSRYTGNKHNTLQHVQNPIFRNRINTYFFFE